MTSSLKMTSTLKQHGGANAGTPSPNAQGSGAVFEIRTALGLTQQELADKIGCSKSTIEKCEASGRLPHSRAVASNLHLLAPPISESKRRQRMRQK